MPLGSSRGGPGGLQEAILELLGAFEGILAALAAKKLQNVPKRCPKSSQNGAILESFWTHFRFKFHSAREYHLRSKISQKMVMRRNDEEVKLITELLKNDDHLE